jgi:hypothetical protein
MVHPILNDRTIPRFMLATGLLGVVACGPRNASDNASLSPEASAISSSAPAGSGVCALLTMGEAQAAFPEVTVATPYTDLEKVGIQAAISVRRPPFARSRSGSPNPPWIRR